MNSNKKVVAITQARMGSTRLPGKVLKMAGDKTFLEIHLERVLKSKVVNKVVLATTDLDKDNPIAELGNRIGIAVFRGSEQDVIDRYYQAALEHNADVIVRITSDCPLIDPVIIDEITTQFLKNENCDFCSNIIERTFPDGMDVEVFSMEALTKAWKDASSSADREHVTYYIWQHSDLMQGNLFKAVNVVAKDGLNYSNLRLTLDYPEDYRLFSKLIEMGGTDRGWLEYVTILIQNPELIEINKYVK